MSGRYDALLLLSFGGPEGPEDVLPFLENVTRGRGIPRERLEAVGEHYHRFGGVSPINAQCRALLAAIRADFAANGLDLPVYWGNRNWTPMLADTVREMASDGVARALVLTTSAYASYSGCRQYREDLARARAEVGPDAPEVDKLRHYFNHPGFVGPMIANTVAALETLPAWFGGDAALAFTTHSVPVAMNEHSGPDGGAYLAQHLEVARLVADGVEAATGRRHRWDLVFQSRSGPPSAALARAGRRRPPGRLGRRRRAGGRGRADRLRLRPHGGALRPGRRRRRRGRRPRADVRPRPDGRAPTRRSSRPSGSWCSNAFPTCPPPRAPRSAGSAPITTAAPRDAVANMRSPLPAAAGED